MKLKFRNNVRFLQEGGELAPETEEMPVEEVNVAQEEQAAPQGGDPLMEIGNMAMQALQNQDCDMAMKVCELFIQLLQQASQSQPEMTPENSQPVYARGGKIAYRIKK